MSTTNFEEQQRHNRLINGLKEERQTWFNHWREIADFFLPRRYPWLMTASQRQKQSRNLRNRKLLDSSSTVALRTLSSGMMDGITSPARPWFSLRISGFDNEQLSHESLIYLQEVERRMYLIISESNFYNAVANLYSNWAGFGTACMAVFEDFEDVIRCYNYAVGEFYLMQDNNGRIIGLVREFNWKVHQVVAEFGIENVSDRVRTAYEAGGNRLLEEVSMRHVIERENPDKPLLKNKAPFRECYWEAGNNKGYYNSVRPFYSWPVVAPRWEVFENDTYGTAPTYDVLPDVQQLQDILLKKAIGFEKQMAPPLIVDQQLQNRPTALHANGITYAPTQNGNFGAKEVYKINTPLQEISNDVIDLRERVKEGLYNDLFKMFSNLETVRSATEIDARKEEQLVHLGPVYQRFESEVLEPFLKRVYSIMLEGDLLPDPPESLEGAKIDVQYVSVLSDAQRAVGTATTERFLAFVGEMSGIYPEVRAVPNPEETVRDYAEALGIKPSNLNSREQTAQLLAAQQEAEALQQQAELGKTVSEGARNLAQAEVGAGQNALQAILG